MRTPRLLGATLVLAVGMFGAGCGKGQSVRFYGGGPSSTSAPLAAPGAVSVATRNTTRLGGSDPATDAAAVARSVYPGLTPASRPQAVVVVDKRNWPAALAASALASAPLSAPLLFSDGGSLQGVSLQALQMLHPEGASALGGAQVLRIGTSGGVPEAYPTRTLSASEPASTAAAVEQLLLAADGAKAPHQVIVLSPETPKALQMPAAGLAAESGAPILYVTAAGVPAATGAALTQLRHPSIYVIDAPAVGPRTLHELAHFGKVASIGGAGAPGEAEAPVANSIAVARFTDGTFGWGIKDPGHGLVFASAVRPLDAPASALLSATGTYAPLLLLTSPSEVPPALAGYLGNIQPAYASAPQFQPVRGVYNHGWLVGDERAISAVTQAELDTLLEISPRSQTSEEP